MIEKPRGTRDLGPDQMKSRKKVEKSLRETAESFGYEEVLTPTFEHTELFLERSGPSIVEEIYSFEDKGGREIALRPEFTASIMRMYAEGMREKSKPLKLFYFGPAFRYERPQSGRYREFWHFGTELIGVGTAKADAENIALSYYCLKEAGLDDITMKISNLQILEDFLKEKAISREDRESIYHAIDNEKETKALMEEFDLGNEFLELIQAPFEEIPNLIEDTSSYEYLDNVIDLLSNYGMDKEDYEIDLKIVRGLDYYSGVVFEIDVESLGAQKQICGGGDYNLGDIFGIDIPSKGFAIGFDRLHLALDQENELPEKKREGCYIIPLDDEVLSYSYEVLSELRDARLKADIDLKDRNIGNALGYADKRGFKYSLIIGEDEVERDEVALKDMGSGEQENVDKKKVVEVI